MPNWITNIVTLVGEQEDIDRLIEFVKSDDNVFDFEKIIPPPSNMFKGSLSLDDERRLAAEGIPNWYGWQTSNWGTKWNSCDAELKENVFRFDTAWNCPRPVFSALSKQFPNLLIKVDYADEDIGYNCGIVSFQDGIEACLVDFIFGSDEACDFASHIKYGKSYEELREDWD